MIMSKENLQDLFRNLRIIKFQNLNSEWLALYNLTQDDFTFEDEE